MLVLIAVVSARGSASAGNYFPPPGDGAPQWASNDKLAFEGTQGLMTVNAEGAPSPRVVAAAGDRVFGLRAAPTEPLLAYGVQVTGGAWLGLVAADGSHDRVLIEGDAVPIAWQSDSSRLFFGRWAGSLTSWASDRISSIRPDGSDLIEYPANVHGIPSPDGTRFAYTADRDQRIHIVNADGSDDRAFTVGVSPWWSPDDSQLAYWGLTGLVVTTIGGQSRGFPIAGFSTNGTIAWSPDGSTVYADSSGGLVAITLATGKRRTLATIPKLSGAVVSSDGTRIAYTAGGECRDRLGIYVANADGTRPKRLSNSCRIIGTPRADVLHADFSRVVLGLGGNDTLYADDTYYFFDGNTLIGGPGDDHLIGGDARDTLIGGPGNDTLEGGPSIDTLIGGPGHDHINGGGGNDVIGAQDGQRDWITCGTNGPGSGVHEHDVVYADKIDIVSPDCEVVHRR